MGSLRLGRDLSCGSSAVDAGEPVEYHRLNLTGHAPCDGSERGDCSKYSVAAVEVCEIAEMSMPEPRAVSSTSRRRGKTSAFVPTYVGASEVWQACQRHSIPSN